MNVSIGRSQVEYKNFDLWFVGTEVGQFNMSKFILGIVLTLFVISFNGEVKRFFVETGIRDEVVTYLPILVGINNQVS